MTHKHHFAVSDLSSGLRNNSNWLKLLSLHI